VEGLERTTVMRQLRYVVREIKNNIGAGKERQRSIPIEREQTTVDKSFH
jgi:hypothetical protein